MVDLISKLRTQMRWIMGIIVVAFLLSTFLMYDSGGRRGPSPDGQTDYVVADVNGRSLKRSELERGVVQYLEQIGSREIASTDMPYIYQAVLNQYAIELQMEQEARESGIRVSEAEAKQAVKDYADRAFPTREAFYQYLERSGQRLADHEKEVAQQLAIERLVRSVIEDVTISEDEAVQFYDTTKNLFFTQPSGFMVSMADFASRDSAEEVRRLLLSGLSWAEATSADVTASMDVISITATPTFVPDSAFEDRLAPMKLEIGEVSPVFEPTSGDYAVGVRNEAVPEKITPWDDVSADIRAMLRQRKESEAVNNFTQRLLSEAKIVIHDASLFPTQTMEAVTEAQDVVSTDIAPAVLSEDVATSTPESGAISATEAPVAQDAISADVAPAALSEDVATSTPESGVISTTETPASQDVVSADVAPAALSEDIATSTPESGAILATETPVAQDVVSADVAPAALSEDVAGPTPESVDAAVVSGE
ncbi:MAG: SurA N-terminal domain-containing protein [Synergistaceae bacterium]|nr:SurA N-terminal domain-containing protein [Synergistaceae bacterium]